MIQRCFAAILLGLMGMQAVGILLCTTLPLWIHRAKTYHALQAIDNQAVQASPKLVEMPEPAPRPEPEPKPEQEKPRRPHTPEDFSWIDGVEHFRGKPLLMLAIPKVLELEANERFVRIHSREFRFEGQMYDIVRTQAGEDTTWYTVYADHKEDRMLAQRDQANKSMALRSTPDTQEPARPALPTPEQSRHLLLRLADPGLLPEFWKSPYRCFVSVEGLSHTGRFCEQFLPPETPPPRKSRS